MTKKLSNLTSRVIIAAIGIPLLIAVCIIGKIPFLIFVLAVGLVSYFEFSRMMRQKHFYTNILIGYISVALIIINEYKFIIDYHLLVLFVMILISLFELFRNKESAAANIGSTLFGIFYIGLFSASIIDLREYYSDSAFTYSQGGYLIISILVSIWICDSAAYFVGTAYGKHKLFPRVSPNKSWEGAIAGFVFAIAGIIAARELFLDFMSLNDVIAIGFIVGLFGQIGDLIESLIKRDARVKDSSSIIPGHGGFFDRFDSLLFTAPIVYLYLKLIS